MKHLTAVQWLIKELNIQGMGATVATALAKEKLQIVKAYSQQLKGSREDHWKKGEDYYNNNYNTKE